MIILPFHPKGIGPVLGTVFDVSVEPSQAAIVQTMNTRKVSKRMAANKRYIYM